MIAGAKPEPAALAAGTDPGVNSGMTSMSEQTVTTLAVKVITRGDTIIASLI
jgi:hypothetical protein